MIDGWRPAISDFASALVGGGGVRGVLVLVLGAWKPPVSFQRAAKFGSHLQGPRTSHRQETRKGNRCPSRRHPSPPLTRMAAHGPRTKGARHAAQAAAVPAGRFAPVPVPGVRILTPSCHGGIMTPVQVWEPVGLVARYELSPQPERTPPRSLSSARLSPDAKERPP